MSRRQRYRAAKVYTPDRVYNSVAITKLRDMMMLSGKQEKTYRLILEGLDELGKKIKTKDEDARRKEIIDLFDQAIAKVKPRVECISKRLGGSNVQVPVVVSPDRQLTLALRWLIRFSRKRKEKSMGLKLGAELNDILVGRGETTAWFRQVLKMAAASAVNAKGG